MRQRVSKLRQREEYRAKEYVRAFTKKLRRPTSTWSRVLGIIATEMGIEQDTNLYIDPEFAVKLMLDALGLVRHDAARYPILVGGWNEMIETLKAADARVRLIGFAPAMMEARESLQAADARQRLGEEQ
ncbi:hypothetical protein LCGC14_0772110 [marine sediment metagenome]|uniref:Uncharacterized protein n=1 Tax=marine sediment metagenome TaxID=412755 RepID=A0A0F9T4T9_9ZZZZ